MSKTSKELRYRAVCPNCGKGFDTRYEAFKLDGKLVCADCYHNAQFAVNYYKKG